MLFSRQSGYSLLAYGKLLPMASYCLWQVTACGKLLPVASYCPVASLSAALLAHKHKRGGVLMDVALTSMALSQSQLMTNVSIAVLKNSLDTADVSADNMIKMLEQSVNPNVGQSIDIKL